MASVKITSPALKIVMVRHGTHAEVIVKLCLFPD